MLEGLDVTLGEVRARVVSTVGRGDEAPTGQMMPFTRRAKNVLELALRRAPPAVDGIPLALGWALFAVAFGFGLLAGWLIWG